MSGSFLKIMELSVIIIQFISSIITAVFCSYCLSEINQILVDTDYKYYLSDFKKKFNIHLEIKVKNYSDYDYEDTALFTVLNGTCSDKLCSSKLLESNYWKGGYLNVNDDFESEGNIGFNIIDPIETCENGKKECESNEYYKTCIYEEYSCPITGVITSHIEFDDKFKKFFQIENEQYQEFNDTTVNSLQDFIMVNTFYDIQNNSDKENSLLITRKADGVPIIGMKISVDPPCHLDYMMKSNLYIEVINSTYYKANILECELFENLTEDFQDSSGDFNLDYLYHNNIKDGRNKHRKLIDESNHIDRRYLKIDEGDLYNHLDKMLGLNSQGITLSGLEGKTISFYIRKLFYCKKECMVKMFKISSLMDVYNIAPIRVLLLRYLNWNFIDIVFIILLNILLRGYYIIKRLQRSPTNRIDEDEKKFQRETSFVVKLLHYFVIVIKLISILVSRFNMDSDVIPTDLNYYDNCLTDELSIHTYRKINQIFLDLIRNISIISNINIWTLVYDFAITLYTTISKYSYRRALKKKIKNKFK